MRGHLFFILTLSLLSSHLSFAQVTEKTVDFSVNPSAIENGDIQIATEWISPQEFRKRGLSVMDLPGLSSLEPKHNHMVATKISFITENSFDSLSYSKMNRAKYISDMLESHEIKQKTSDLWNVTNKVKAYSIPFKVNFDLQFREVSKIDLKPELLSYLKKELSAYEGEGRERLLILDMTNFSQLMYRNYSVVYMKELGDQKTLIFAGILSAFNRSKANGYFQYPPVSTTKGTMLRNLKSQTLHMAKIIKQ